MKITSLEIYGYGKWVDQKFNLNQTMQIFYGQNESGKTTLMSFIHSILFGFPPRNSQKLRYEPKDSSKYGGKIHFQDHVHGKGFIERISGKSSGNVQVVFESGQQGDEKVLEYLLRGVDRQTFEQVYSFHLSDLEELKNLNKEDFDRYFMNLGLHGSKDYLDRADQLETEANRIYKTSGRVPQLNRQIADLKNKAQKLDQAKEENKILLQEYAAIEEKNQAKEKILKQIEENQTQATHLKEVLRQWSIKEELASLDRWLRVNQPANINDDQQIMINDFQKKLETNQQKRQHLKEKIHELDQIYSPSDDYKLYTEQIDRFKELEEKLDTLESKKENYQKSFKDQTLLKEEFRQLMAQEGLKNRQNLPKVWSHEVQETFNRHLTIKSNYLEKSNQLKSQVQYYNQRILEEEQTIDQLEQRIEQEETSHRKTNTTSSTKALAIAISVIVLIAGLIFSRLFVSLIGGLGLAFSLLWQGMAGLNKKDSENNYTIQTWREKLALIDELNMKSEEAKGKLQNLDLQYESKQKLISGIYQKFKLPESFPLENSQERRKIYQTLHDMDRKMDQKSKELENLNHEMENAISPFQIFLDQYPNQATTCLKIENLTHFYNKVIGEFKQMTEYNKALNKLNDELSQVEEADQTIYQERKKLFRDLKISTQEEYILLVEKQKEYQQKKKQFDQLQHSYKHLLPYLSEQESTLRGKLKEINQSLTSLKEREKEMVKDSVSLEYEVNQLRDGSNYSTYMQEFEIEKSALLNSIDQWLKYKLAAQFIRTTLVHVISEKYPLIKGDALAFFKRITGESYQDLLIDEEGIFVQDKEGKVFSASELSRGTNEPLYVSLRFAYIKHMAKDNPLPIIVDDGFVNLDSERKNKMLELLIEMSQYTQVIYFTFDQPKYESTQNFQMIALSTGG